MTNRYYAGIGARSCPLNILNDMTHLSTTLNGMGYTLRSGNADGADFAFAKGVEDEKAQIWLPWKNFNIGFQRIHPQHTYRLIREPDDESWDSINKFHPNGPKLNTIYKKFMARNYRQVRGLGEPDSEFVICWTHDGTAVGGTGQALRIAKNFNIPIFNLFNLNVGDILNEVEKLNLIQ